MTAGSEYETAQAEAEQVKKSLGIGTPLEDRIRKVIDNQYQYASAGDTRAFLNALNTMREALQKIAAYKDGGTNIGISNTCGELNRIAKEALNG